MNVLNKDDKFFMNFAIKEAHKAIANDYGGPFGCVIVDKEGMIIGKAYDKVLYHNDPTLHCGTQAVSLACQKLNSRDLSSCTAYFTREPCMMCLGACQNAGIKTVCYAMGEDMVEMIGFKYRARPTEYGLTNIEINDLIGTYTSKEREFY